MNYLLDTCAVSELFRKIPNTGLTEWINARPQEILFISVITVGEIQKGISKLPDAALSRRLQYQLETFMDFYGHRILPLNRESLLRWGRFCAQSEAKGVSLPIMDSLIAATALSQDMEIVTRNVKDLERCGARVLNPWTA